MLFELELVDLIDEDGLAFSYYHFDSMDANNLEWPWLQGIKFGQPPTEPLRLSIDFSDPDAGEFADCISSPLPLMTSRFREVLNRCGVSNVDYYPVRIQGSERFDQFPEYYAFNIVGKVAIADQEHSTYKEAFGHMGANLYDKLAIDPKAAAGLDFFRMAEHLATIIVSERIKTESEKSGIDTLKFIPLPESQA
ncbi:MAG: imm11 family protein [Methylomonas sp.]